MNNLWAINCANLIKNKLYVKNYINFNKKVLL
jgi:hypothetical protein